MGASVPRIVEWMEKRKKKKKNKTKQKSSTGSLSTEIVGITAT